MNWLPPSINSKKDRPPNSVTPVENRPSMSAKSLLKNLVKKMPFFREMDFFRRRILDSHWFDFSVERLAKMLEDWPGILLLDTTNRCNAKCVWCPNPDLENLGLMDMDLYRKIIDDYAVRGGMLHFGTFGEPLMDKHLRERIEYARRFSSIERINVLTNGFFLNAKIIPALIEHSIGVEISLDELDSETFEMVKKMSFDTTRKGILDLLEANRNAGNKISISIRIKTLKTMKETLENEFFQTLSSYPCHLDLTPINENIISNWAGMFDTKGFLEKYIARTRGTDRFGHKAFNSANEAPCTQLWKWLVVYWDGNVVLCCADMFNQSSVGNLRNQSIEEVWTGPVMTDFRKKMVDRKRFDIPLCQTCDIHLSWHNLKAYYDENGRFLASRNFV